MSIQPTKEPVFRDLVPPPTDQPASVMPSRPRGVLPARTFVGAALIFAVVFAVLHLAGFREYTSILNGTVANEGVSWRTSVFFGTLYILSYLGFLLLTPILLLAAALLKAWERFFCGFCGNSK